jgi:hypothetical protein
MEHKNTKEEKVEKDSEPQSAVVFEIKPKLALNPIESLFNDTWSLYQERFAVLIKIVLLPVLVTILGYTISNLHLPFSSPLGHVVLFVGWLMSLFNVLPLIYSIQNKTDVDDSYRAAMPLVLPFAWLAILEILAVIGGLVILIVPGIWLIFAFSLASYVFVLEGRRGLDVLRQSKNYIAGYWWAVLGRLLLLGIFLAMLSIFIQWLVVPIMGNVGGNIAAMILALFTTPFTAIFSYHIYNNLRALKPDCVEGRVAKMSDGFIKACAIVGIVALIIIAFIALFFTWHGIVHSFELSHWIYRR